MPIGAEYTAHRAAHRLAEYQSCRSAAIRSSSEGVSKRQCGSDNSLACRASTREFKRVRRSPTCTRPFRDDKRKIEWLITDDKSRHNWHSHPGVIFTNISMLGAKDHFRTMTKIILGSAVFLCIVIALHNLSWTQRLVCSSIPVISLGQFCSSVDDRPWELFHHLGGNGPWIPRAPTRSSPNTELPINCKVNQVHMIARHAERFPTRTAGDRHLALLERVEKSATSLTGSLSFLANWTYFTNVESPAFEELTTTGPYAGTVQAHNTGRILRQRYDELVNPNQTTNYWTCSSGRDVTTARFFGDGFFGADWATNGAAQLNIIPEDSDRGADTLTPGDTCLKYVHDVDRGHDRGYTELRIWQQTFLTPIVARLTHDAAGITFTPDEVYSMMEMCGFEILARGHSPWCDVFTQQEWLEFEYARDLLHYYRAGPGNPFAGAMGWLWLNATTALVSNDNITGVYFSFVHDGDIVPLLATLGILDETGKEQMLPNDRMKAGRRWRMSDVVPMGGRLVFEKVTCDNTGLGRNLRRSYVRLFINDGIVDLEKSAVGAGLSMGAGMNQWVDMVQRKGQHFGDFGQVCGLPADAPGEITFLRAQYQQQ